MSIEQTKHERTSQAINDTMKTLIDRYLNLGQELAFIETEILRHRTEVIRLQFDEKSVRREMLDVLTHVSYMQQTPTIR